VGGRGDCQWRGGEEKKAAPVAPCISPAAGHLVAARWKFTIEIRTGPDAFTRARLCICLENGVYYPLVRSCDVGPRSNQRGPRPRLASHAHVYLNKKIISATCKTPSKRFETFAWKTDDLSGEKTSLSRKHPPVAVYFQFPCTHPSRLRLNNC